MPELPEVENARQLVANHVQGKRIRKATVADDEKVINDVSPQQLQEALAGRTLVAAKRRGKQMWWELDEGPALLVHFGMTGGLCIKGIGAAHYKSFTIDDSAWPPKYCKVELEFDDGTQLAFCDSRRFAKVRFLEAPEARPPISELGWDPLLDWPALEAFAAKLGGQRRAIKAVLLDQSFSAGVGNWVADEVLYQSRIHPEQPANSILADQVAALHRAIKDVCELAVAADADANRFPDTWLFHYRWGKGSSTKSKIGGHIIDHITVGGRTSAFVPALQKLRKAAAAAAAPAGKKTAAGKAAAKKAAADDGADGSSRKSGGGGKKRKSAAEEQTVGGTAEGAVVQEAAAAEVAAEAAAEALEKQAEAAGAEAALPAPRRGRGKKGAPAAATAAAADPGPAGKSAGRGRQRKQQEQQQEAAEPRNAAAAEAARVAGTAAATAGRGAKRFRAGRPAAAEAPPAATTNSNGAAVNGGSQAGGHKRKADGAATATGADAVVKLRRGRARS
ncbi:hypothetical protein ABPG75_010480 [Micractinium tetrahymenae]